MHQMIQQLQVQGIYMDATGNPADFGKVDLYFDFYGKSHQHINHSHYLKSLVYHDMRVSGGEKFNKQYITTGSLNRTLRNSIVC